MFALTGWSPSLKIRPKPPPTGTVHRSSGAARQFAVTSGELVRYQPCAMGGETDQWTPYLFQNNRQIFPWIGKPGYNLITDMRLLKAS